MQIRFITSNGFYQKGDVAFMIDGIARQMIREGRAIEYISPNQMSLAELRAIANRRKPMAAKGNRKLSRGEIDKLYGRTFKGQPFAYGRSITIR
jgi:hypothetical protein